MVTFLELSRSNTAGTLIVSYKILLTVHGSVARIWINVKTEK